MNLYYFVMADNNNLAPWDIASQMPTQQALLDNQMKAYFEGGQLFCSTLKNLAIPLAESSQMIKNGSRVKRVQSCIARYKSVEIPTNLALSTTKLDKNFQLQSLKQQIKKLDSLEYFSLSQKAPPIKQTNPIKLYQKRERTHSAVCSRRLLSRSHKKQNNNKPKEQGNIFINQKIGSLIKNTQSKLNATKFSLKLNTIIKGYVKSHIPQSARENQIRRQKFLRQLLTPKH